MKRDSIDFHEVAAKHEEIHARLRNWARWAKPPGGAECSPMFRGYRCTDVWAAPEVSDPVNTLDAHKVAKGVAALPELHRHSIQWCYVRPVAVIRIRRALKVSEAALWRLVTDGREMLVNRRV
jgi:hypothetical protein